MGDLFHEDVPFSFIEQVFDVIRDCRTHTFQLLTKRPQRVLDYWEWRQNHYLTTWKNSVWPDNAWLGVTAENQRTADERILLLLKGPAAIRFVSIEPMLGPVGLLNYIGPSCGDCGHCPAPGGRCHQCDEAPAPDGWRPKPGLDWVIVGGETGHGARPMHPDWVRKIRDDCQEAGVPFFFKQWGEYSPNHSIGHKGIWVKITGGVTEAPLIHCDCEDLKHYAQRQTMYRVGRKAAGRLLDGREWNDMPVTAGNRE